MTGDPETRETPVVIVADAVFVAPGLALAWLIHDNHPAEPWLIDTTAGPLTACVCARCCPHEQLGPLPAGYRPAQ